ncbi:MAG: AAA family ATPase [Clostridiales bacterium]|nr:AAA family ATPase [Clostridiales bacterium]
MPDNNIYTYVEKLTADAFGKDQERSVLEVICGYAKLASMDEMVLHAMFSDEDDQKELEKIVQIFKDNGIDVKLLKAAMPFLRGKEIPSSDGKKLQEVLTKNSRPSVKEPAAQILKDLLEGDVPGLANAKEGKDLDDVLNYLETVPKRPEPEKEPESTKENKPEEKKGSEEAEKGKSENRSEGKKEEKDSSDKKSEGKSEAKAEEKATSVLSEIISLDKLTLEANRLYERLKVKVFGQDEAIRLFAQGYFQSRLFRREDEEKKGPKSTFFFVGPSGVGKTYLAETAVEILDVPFRRFNMGQYCQHDSLDTLIGIPKNYQGTGEGALTSYVRKNPSSIILFDEIEKANSDIITMFLQILDDGKIEDKSTGKSVSFKDTILIFTSNAGRRLYEDNDRENLSTLHPSIIQKEIIDEEILSPAICSRLFSGNVIMFNRLSVHILVDIINEKLKKDAALFKNTYNFDVTFDPRVAPMIILSQSARSDARKATAQSELLLRNEIHEFSRFAVRSPETFKKIKSFSFTLDLDDASEEVRYLFENKEITTVLYIGDPADFKDVPLSPKCKIEFSDCEHALETIATKDISYVLIHIQYAKSDNKKGYLSLDDIKSESVRAFDLLSEKMPNLPIYLVHKEEIWDGDMINFIERGARAFIHWKNDLEMADQLAQIADMVYLQARANELSSRGRVLSYNTAQKISKGVGNIVFYDFKISIAADAGEGNLLLSDEQRPKEKFSDVIGAQNAIDELSYFVDYLKNPKKHMARGEKPAMGILLYGPPGTGKTMLARAMAGESDVTFFATSATEFMDKYVGESERKIRQIFSVAKKFAPSIIFIDEIDAIGKQRTGDSSTAHTESMLNALLTEMEGFVFNPAKPVFVIAATNYGQAGSVGKELDRALWRRFDNHILVDLPVEEERKKYINILLGKVKDHVVSNEAVSNLAKRTPGESLANLKAIFGLAVRKANMAGIKLDDNTLLNAYEEFMYGEKRENNEEYTRSVAIHESGHAYVCALSGEKPSFVTIVSRGDFGGYMQHENSEKTPSYTKEQLIWKIRCALAGRAAEVEFFGDKGINTGVSGDIRQATSIAMRIICTYGMVDGNLTSVDFDDLIGSESGDRRLNQANEILLSEMGETQKLVHEGKAKIKKLADYLMKNNQATEEKILEIFGMEEKPE